MYIRGLKNDYISVLQAVLKRKMRSLILIGIAILLSIGVAQAGDWSTQDQTNWKLVSAIFAILLIVAVALLFHKPKECASKIIEERTSQDQAPRDYDIARFVLAILLIVLGAIIYTIYKEPQDLLAIFLIGVIAFLIIKFLIWTITFVLCKLEKIMPRAKKESMLKDKTSQTHTLWLSYLISGKIKEPMLKDMPQKYKFSWLY